MGDRRIYYSTQQKVCRALVSMVNNSVEKRPCQKDPIGTVGEIVTFPKQARMSQTEQSRQSGLSCPLCPQDFFKSWPLLKHHLARIHFKRKFLTLTGSTLTKCGICGKTWSKSAAINVKSKFDIVYHLAFTHGLVEQLIPEDVKALRLGLNLQPSECLLRLKEEILKTVNQDQMSRTKHVQPPNESQGPQTEKEFETNNKASQCICLNLKDPAVSNASKHNNNTLPSMFMRNIEEKQCVFCVTNFKSDERITLTPKIREAVENCQKLQPNIVLPKINIDAVQGIKVNDEIPIKTYGNECLGSKIWPRDQHKMLDKTKELAIWQNNICFICSKMYQTSETLKKHIALIHYREELLSVSNSSLSKCGICEKWFPDKKKGAMTQSITWHLVSKHGLLKQLVPQYSKQLHHIVSTKHQCFLCLGIYKSDQSLTSHLAQYHFKDELLRTTCSSQSKCGICGKKFFKPGRPKSRVDHIITWHLAIKHGLLQKLIHNQFGKAELNAQIQDQPIDKVTIDGDKSGIHEQESEDFGFSLPKVGAVEKTDGDGGGARNVAFTY